MYSLLLAIIYIAFISLGLPDSLLGSAWPVIHGEMGVPLSYAGIVSMIIYAGTIISSLLSDRLTKKLGTGLVTAASVLATAAALFGFSVSSSFLPLCLWAVPYGLGAGAVDAALNNYVALNYTARHMSWLHCFWGVGASVSPFIMSFCLTGGVGWHSGYRAVSVIQLVLAAALFASLPIWRRFSRNASNDTKNRESSPGLLRVVKLRGVGMVSLAFFGYCAMESTAGLWASSYLVTARGSDAETAAKFASLFFLGITFGRFISGFAADRLGDRKMVRIGIAVTAVGVALLGLPLKTDITALAGLMITGLGCAPIYPSIIHATPTNFGKENSQAIVGLQMASAYCGSTLMPPLFGFAAEKIGIGFYPIFLAVFVVLVIVMTEVLNRSVDRARQTKNE